MGTLVVAAGGGGDAITGSALAGPLGLAEPPVVMTYSWDRLMVDPVPGPRRAGEFSGLCRLAPAVLEIVSSTTSIAPAFSSLPGLAVDLPSRLLLLDPAGGAVQMAAQVEAAAAYFRADEVALIDVGGDAITDGTDSGLRSPLADQLALAACVRAGLPARLVVAAPGVDGELPSATILARLRALGAVRLPGIGARDLGVVRKVFTWHPSEASGLFAAAVAGRRGLVEVRDAGDQVRLDTTTASLLSVDAKAAIAVTPARWLTETRSLEDADRIMRETVGLSELTYETRKAQELRTRKARAPTRLDLPIIDSLAQQAGQRGADYVSMRRLAELFGATSLDAFATFSALLVSARPGHYEPSIYRT